MVGAVGARAAAALGDEQVVIRAVAHDESVLDACAVGGQVIPAAGRLECVRIHPRGIDPGPERAE